ncbi:MAG: hypothetical protein N2167_04765 [Flavobacteriales bacterium]|nr:hypothetical protein [Flavobacteriales bacterium]
MDNNELNIPGLKPKPNLFEMPEGYSNELEEKLMAQTLNQHQLTLKKERKIKLYAWGTSLAASVFFAIWMIYSVYFKNNISNVSDHLWTEEDEWVDAFSAGGEYELIDEDFVQLTTLLLEEKEKESAVQAIESWLLQEEVEEEVVVEVLITEV